MEPLAGRVFLISYVRERLENAIFFQYLPSIVDNQSPSLRGRRTRSSAHLSLSLSLSRLPFFPLLFPQAFRVCVITYYSTHFPATYIGMRAASLTSCRMSDSQTVFANISSSRT